MMADTQQQCAAVSFRFHFYVLLLALSLSANLRSFWPLLRSRGAVLNGPVPTGDDAAAAAAAAASLHRQVAELHRTARRWRGRSLDMDEAVEARAREIDESAWCNPKPMDADGRRPGYYLANIAHNEDPRYPFQQVIFANGSRTGVLALAAPLYANTFYRAEAARGLFWRLKQRGHIVVGLSSYRFFPQPSDDPHDDRIVTSEDWEIYEAMDGWLHCARDPDRVLPAGVPRILWSESDTTDPFLGEKASQSQDRAGVQSLGPGIFGLRSEQNPTLVPYGQGIVRKQFDLIYSNLDGAWNDYNRNWTLAKPAIINLIERLNLTILVVGRDLNGEPDLYPYLASGKLVSKPELPFGLFLHHMESARALWAPNVADASPRVLTQALCKNVPILVNRHIAGGWKYVNDKTGAFFSDEHDVVDAARQLFSPESQAKLAPREYYQDRYGPAKSALRLQAFLELTVGRDRLERAARMVNDPRFTSVQG